MFGSRANVYSLKHKWIKNFDSKAIKGVSAGYSNKHAFCFFLDRKIMTFQDVTIFERQAPEKTLQGVLLGLYMIFLINILFPMRKLKMMTIQRRQQQMLLRTEAICRMKMIPITTRKRCTDCNLKIGQT